MALVYDPVLQRYVDDGRPVPGIAFAGGVGAAVQNAVNNPNQVAGAAVQNAVNIPNQVAGAAAQNAINISRQVAGGTGASLVTPMVEGIPGLGLKDWATYGMRTPMVAMARSYNDLRDSQYAPAPVGGPELGAVGDALPPPTVRQPQPLSADILAQANAGIANVLAANRQETAQASAQTAPAARNGVNFGFGVGGSETARQYLDRMAAQDAEAAAQDTQGGIVRDILAEARGLSSTSSIGDIALARQRNALRQPALAATSEQAALATSGRQQREQEQLRAEAQLGVAGANNAAAMDREIAGREIAGRYGLMQAEADATGRMALQQQKAESPEGMLAQQRAIQLQLQQDAYVDALINGDQELALRIMANQGPGTVKLQTDPVQGRVLSKMLPNGKLVPLTPEEAAIYGQ